MARDKIEELAATTEQLLEYTDEILKQSRRSLDLVQAEQARIDRSLVHFERRIVATRTYRFH